MSALVHYTAEMVRALPDDGKRYETIHGELLVTPAPGGRHQPVVVGLILLLGEYLKAHRLEREILTSPADIIYGPDTLVQPDLFVADTAAFLASGDWEDVKTLYLVIEVVSPSSVKTDRTIKRELYQEQGILTYWVVDIEQQQVEVWTPEASVPVIERERVTWKHPAATTECVIELGEVFGI